MIKDVIVLKSRERERGKRERERERETERYLGESEVHVRRFLHLFGLLISIPLSKQSSMFLYRVPTMLLVMLLSKTSIFVV